MGTAKEQQTQLGFANTAYGFVLSSLPNPLPRLAVWAEREEAEQEVGRRVGVGEEPAQNKQVLRRVVYRAGGPDVSQEAPLQIGTTVYSALPPPLKKLGEPGEEIGGWG